METKKYTVINLDWDYTQRTVVLSMPNYIRITFYIFRYTLVGGLEYSPRVCAPIQYDQKVQYLNPSDTSDYLSPNDTNIVQQVCCTFLYYTIVI